MRNALVSSVCSALSILVAACGPASAPAGGGLASGGAAFRLVAYCALDGFEPSLRETFVIIDEARLAPAQTAEEFVANNGPLRDLLITLGDVERAMLSGVIDRRERITLLLAPEDGGTPELLFTGCAPGFADQERAAAMASESTAERFFTGGRQQELEEAADRFRGRVLAAGVLAARARTESEAPGADIEGLEDTSLMRSIAAGGGMIRAGQPAPRLILYTDLSVLEAPPQVEAARAAGFNAGFDAGLDLGRASIVLVGPGGGDEARRGLVSAFFTAQHAALEVWAETAPADLAPAPRRIDRYLGAAQYPGGEEAVQMRIAVDRNGRLVNSWMTLRGLPDRSTPMTGQLTCASGTECEASSDGQGFAQAWSLSPGGAPEFEADMPFAGARDWRFEVSGERVSGEVYDAAIDQFGPDRGNDSIPFELVRQPDADF